MTKVMRRACTEIDEIFKYLPTTYVEKVPLKFRRMFYDARLLDYHVEIDPNRSIENQNIAYETRVILTILKLNYWCNSAEEKNAIQQKLKENERRTVQKYDFSKLNAKENDNVTEIHLPELSKINNTLPIESTKQSWLSKIWNKIKRVFKRK